MSGAAPAAPAHPGVAAWRLPLLVLGFAALALGAGAGLARLGYGVPGLAAANAAWHGPLMLCGFFGVVITLERAVAIGRAWAYLAPLAAGAGTVALAAGATLVGQWLYVAAALGLLAASLDILRRQRALFTLTLALGAACWGAGNLLWASGVAVHEVLSWWLAFLILTIAGERLELSRFLPPSAWARRVFVLILLLAGTGIAGGSRAWGLPAFAAALLALAAWLLKQDIARRTVRQRGLTRFIAICLLSGYVWLAAGATIVLGAGALVPGTRAYDAGVHALALGFVFSMVFGHAPIIFPAVLRVAVPYHPVFYAPLALLHGSLALRLAGDAIERASWVRLGGLGGAIALAAFVIVTATAIVRGRRRR